MLINLTLQVVALCGTYFISPFGEASGVGGMRALLNGASIEVRNKQPTRKF